MRFIAIIPARYASTRFPGKPLAMLGGKTVIQRVYEQVTSTRGAQEPSPISAAYVATDDQRIYDNVLSWGGKAIMTRSDHKSGTDRIEEAMEKIEASSPVLTLKEGASSSEETIVVNVQGDEPFIQPEQISQLCHCFDDADTQIATLGIRFNDIHNPNSPKIVVDNRGFAMYFSRSAIPYCRGKKEEEWPLAFPYLKHIGMYAYRREVLREVTRLPQSSLEIAESLEQLRWLQNGYKIKVAETTMETIGIDTPEDLAKANAQLNKK